jgi:peroxiredoxin
MADATETLRVGDEAPDFKLKGTDKTEFKLSDLKGQKNVVLNFFPAAFSPVCSTR